jgi:hypothetical protein
VLLHVAAALGEVAGRQGPKRPSQNTNKQKRAVPGGGFNFLDMLARCFEIREKQAPFTISRPQGGGGVVGEALGNFEIIETTTFKQRESEAENVWHTQSQEVDIF